MLRNLLPGIVWEAAAGAGHLVDALRRAGREVVATDLYPDHSGPGIARHDFLHGPLPPETCGAAMITNPPNSQLTEFMVRGVTLIDIGWPAGLVLLIRQGHHTTKGRAAAFNHAALEIKCCWRPSWKPRQPGDKQP